MVASGTGGCVSVVQAASNGRCFCCRRQTLKVPDTIKFRIRKSKDIIVYVLSMGRETRETGNKHSLLDGLAYY